jgi:lysozyme family protein
LRVNFKDCLAVTLKHEGGYSNHPKDKGGKTQWGIIQRVYNSYRRLEGSEPQDVRKITKSEMEDIYKRFYWDKVEGDKLPFGLDLVVFDFAVNSGPSRSIKFLQKAINKVERRNLVVDGLMGPATLDAATDLKDLEGVIARVCDDRLSWLTTLWNWSTFKGGWSRRLKDINAQALKMAFEGLRIPVVRPSVPEELGKAGDREKTNKTLWTTLTGFLGTVGTGLLSAVSNPYALTFALIAMLVGAYFLYRYLRQTRLA